MVGWVSEGLVEIFLVGFDVHVFGLLFLIR